MMLPNYAIWKKNTFDCERFSQVSNFLHILQNYNMQMRFLVTSVILLGIVRIIYLMSPSVNRPYWDPPNPLWGPQNPLWSAFTTSAVLCGSTWISRTFWGHHCPGTSLTFSIWDDPLPQPYDGWANRWTSTAVLSHFVTTKDRKIFDASSHLYICVSVWRSVHPSVDWMATCFFDAKNVQFS